MGRHATDEVMGSCQLTQAKRTNPTLNPRGRRGRRWRARPQGGRAPASGAAATSEGQA